MAAFTVDKISVESAVFIDPKVIEVKGKVVRLKGTRKTPVEEVTKIPREYTVHFDNKGQIKFGHFWLPYMDGVDTYLRPEYIPDAVKEAATALYRQENRS